MSETDPTGLGAHDPGAKLDAGKPRLGLVLGDFSNALEQVGRVGTYGANKYSDGGWRSVSDGQARYTDAMLRHLLTELGGEVFDTETGLYHAAQTAWNALARLELLLKEETNGRREETETRRHSGPLSTDKNEDTHTQAGLGAKG